ncbi:MAG TPA: restriction endonuclease subunit S [Longimicrobium sp.]|jgi:type I restriction enzyme S subunit|uniref:restriction endonuclease subunit S n=1 Tax=Longimicrobium sp. TaxID=2029185 RepID=UPI002EDAD0DD
MKTGDRSALVPKLRFPEFRNAPGWTTLNGDTLFKPINNRGAAPALPVLAITQEHGAIPRDQIDYHVSVTAESVAGYKEVCEGDFIISLRSFQGGIEYSRYHGICSPAYVILRKKGDENDHFFRYLFKSERFIQQLTRNIEGIRDGKMISYAQFSEQLLPVPGPPEQQKIADCLGSLDDLIAAEGRKLEALQQHKQGLMQQLFVPPGETVPRLRFPEFRDAREWTPHKFGDFVVRSFYGTSAPTAETGKYPVLRMGNMVGGRLDFSNLVYIDLNPQDFEFFRLRRGDIMLNRTNSRDLVGKVSIFDHDSECITASYIVSFRLDENQIDPWFCNLMLNAPMYQWRIKLLATPSISQANINPTTFKTGLDIVIPKPAEQRQIAACLSSLDDMLAAQSQKTERLKAHKQGLLQQLFPSSEDVSR